MVPRPREGFISCKLAAGLGGGLAEAASGHRTVMADLPTERQFGDYGTWPGRDVFDPNGERLGAVREIYLDRDTHQPEWVLVDVDGGDARFVPLADASIEDTAIRVAHRRDAVEAAPGIGAEPRIDPEQERRLYAHYGVPTSEEQSSTVLPEGEAAPSEYAAATPEPEAGAEPEGWAPPAPAATPQATMPGATSAAAIPPPDAVSAAQPEPAVPSPDAAATEPPAGAPPWEASAAPQPETAAGPPAEAAPAPPAGSADAQQAETADAQQADAAAAPPTDAVTPPPTEPATPPPTDAAAAPQSNGATTPQPEPALPPAPEPPRLPPPAAPHENLLDRARSRPALIGAIVAALALLMIVRRLRD
ncbi:MAG TPA: PRC-barrel domain-containing protein [Solirubrobacteraceae bacterium]